MGLTNAMPIYSRYKAAGNLYLGYVKVVQSATAA